MSPAPPREIESPDVAVPDAADDTGQGHPGPRPIPLVRRRCFTHPRREAVAVCPECGRTFCRECVTEHEDRVVCARCLAKLAATKQHRKSPHWRQLRLVLQSVGALLLLWLLFYALGAGLLNLPSAFHEGEIEEQRR